MTEHVDDPGERSTLDTSNAPSIPVAEPGKSALALEITLAVVLLLDMLLVGLGTPGGRGLQPSDLEVTPTSVKHRLGFATTFPAPGFVPDTALQRAMMARVGEQSDMHMWVFSHAEVPGVLMLQVSRSPKMDEQDFREYAMGMRRGNTKSGRVVLVSDTLIAGGARREFRMVTRMKDQPIVSRIRCLATAPERRPAFVVCAGTMSADGDSLAAFRDSLTVARAGRFSPV